MHAGRAFLFGIAFFCVGLDRLGPDVSTTFTGHTVCYPSVVEVPVAALSCTIVHVLVHIIIYDWQSRGCMHLQPDNHQL